MFFSNLFNWLINYDEQERQLQESMQQSQSLNDMMEQQHHMMNPYENPGQDVVVDESHFGIDHGLGIANPENDSAMAEAMDSTRNVGMDMNADAVDDSWMDVGSADADFGFDNGSSFDNDCGSNDFGGGMDMF